MMPSTHRSILALSAALLPLAFAVRADAPPAAIVIVPPERVVWSAALPLAPEISIASVVGSAAAPGPYALRVRLPAGSRIPPHTHPDARLVTVLEGVYGFGQGARMDEATTLQRLAAGTVILVPAGVVHYATAPAGPVTYQESGVGPSGSTFLEPPGATPAAQR